MDGKMFANQKRDPFDRRSAWVWLIEHAAFDGSDRGQLSFSVRYLAEAWGWSKSRVSRYLQACVLAGMIECPGDATQMVITLCKYDEYQSRTKITGTQEPVPQGQQRDTTGTNIKEGSKEEEDSEANASAEAPRDRTKEVFDRGVLIVGTDKRSLLGKLRKQYGEVTLLEAIYETEREQPIDPLEYLIGCCKRSKSDGPSHSRGLDILKQAALDADEREGGRGPLEAAAGPAWGTEELGDGSAALHRLPVRYSA
jgi:hypothetical protein